MAPDKSYELQRNPAKPRQRSATWCKPSQFCVPKRVDLFFFSLLFFSGTKPKEFRPFLRPWWCFSPALRVRKGSRWGKTGPAGHPFPWEKLDWLLSGWHPHHHSPSSWSDLVVRRFGFCWHQISPKADRGRLLGRRVSTSG